MEKRAKGNVRDPIYLQIISLINSTKYGAFFYCVLISLLSVWGILKVLQNLFLTDFLNRIAFIKNCLELKHLFYSNAH